MNNTLTVYLNVPPEKKRSTRFHIEHEFGFVEIFQYKPQHSEKAMQELRRRCVTVQALSTKIADSSTSAMPSPKEIFAKTEYERIFGLACTYQKKANDDDETVSSYLDAISGKIAQQARLLQEGKEVMIVLDKKLTEGSLAQIISQTKDRWKEHVTLSILNIRMEADEESGQIVLQCLPIMVSPKAAEVLMPHFAISPGATESR